MFINFQKEKTDIIKKMKPAYSEKIRLFTENIEKNNLSQDEILQIGKSYFSGDNNFPINYSKAAEYFKLSADKGNSEAQWRYAIMCQNSIEFTQLCQFFVNLPSPSGPLLLLF